ncbi:MerR family DNA-binding transcriptional regulator, partial [Eubacterium aggregans]
MDYTIKEASERTGLSIHTLRFYDKSGLLPMVGRT